MCTADNSHQNDREPLVRGRQLEKCKGCGGPTDPEDLDDGYCLICSTEDADDLADDTLDDYSDGDDMGSRGSLIA